MVGHGTVADYLAYKDGAVIRHQGKWPHQAIETVILTNGMDMDLRPILVVGHGPLIQALGCEFFGWNGPNFEILKHLFLDEAEGFRIIFDAEGVPKTLKIIQG